MLATRNQTATLKLLTFTVGHLHLALRLEGVKKVIPTPKIFKSSDTLLGLAQVEDQEVIVLDLHQTLYGQAATEASGFLIVVQTPTHRYGVTAAGLPTMREVATADFRAIPADYRDRDALGISDSMAQITLENQETTSIFLLDPGQLLHRVDPKR
jgi:purine-binding chemotaxis protein CheW